MGVATAADIADKLMADGVAPDMPVAVLERGTRAGARACGPCSPISATMVEREKVTSPAIIVVGEVVDAVRRRGPSSAAGRRTGGGDRVKILTGNDLATGDVIWWTGGGWSRHVEDAVDVGDHGEAIAAREEAARRVNAPYVIDATATPDGPAPRAHQGPHPRARARPCAPT